MTRRARLPFVFVGLLLLAAPRSAFADAQPPESGMSRATWDGLGVEGQWVLYRARAAQGTDHQERWRAFFAEAEAWLLLEWCALYESWIGTGNRLAQVNAPQWMRAAIWSLAAVDSHSFEKAAVTVLEARAGEVLGYVERFPQLLRDDWLRHAVDRWREHGVVPGSAEKLLPPLTPSQVYAHLRAPTRVSVLAPGTPDPWASAPLATRYVHQVERAMLGVAISNHRPAPALRQLERLLGHPTEAIRHAALLTYARLPEHLAPSISLRYRAGDPGETDRVREAAVFALGRIAHPAVFGTLLALAEDPDHPAWRAGVARLVDRQDPYVGRLLHRLAKTSLGTPSGTFLARELERLETAVERRTGKQRRERLARHLERAAWLRLSGHPLGADYAQELVRRAREDVETFAPEVARLRSSYAMTADLLAPRWWTNPGRVLPTGEAFAAEVRRILAELDARGG